MSIASIDRIQNVRYADFVTDKIHVKLAAPGMSHLFGSKVGQVDPIGTNPVFFSGQLLV